MDTEPVTGCLLLGLQELYEDQRHCDIDIIVQKQSFPCHKVVISAAAKYFDVMFTSGMQEVNAKSVTLHDISATVFKDILTFVYYCKNVITEENVEELLNASCLLQIESLKNCCEKYLISKMSHENAIGFWVIANSFSCKKLKDVSKIFISKNFENVSTHEEVLKLSKEELIDIISDDDLDVSTEDIVCKTVMRWIKADESSRRHTIVDLLPEIRLCQVSLDCILDDIYSKPFVHKDEKCMKLLKDAVKYHAMPERRHTFKSLEIKLRNDCNQSAVFVCFGRRTSRYSSDVIDAIAYNAANEKWYTLGSIPFDLGDEFATCPFGDDMFVSGGTSKSEACFRFSAKQCKWLNQPPMAQGRYRHCMVALKNSIYALGGYNFGTLSSVEKLDLTTNTWETDGELKQAVDSAAAAIHGEKILIFGGWQGFAEESAAIQSYDTDTQTSMIFSYMPSPQKDIRAVTYNNKTYIVCSSGDVFVYNVADGTIKKIDTLKNFHRKNFGVFKDCKSLNVDEDENDDMTKISDEIVIVNHASSREITSLFGKLPAPFEIYGCYQTVIKTKYPLVEFSEQFEYM